LGKFIDLTGKRFGRLVVIKFFERKFDGKRDRIYWLCQCDCGNEKISEGATLRSGGCKSCGCLVKETSAKNLDRVDNVIDLSGQQFGRLVVLEKALTPSHVKTKGQYWLCKCSCGNKKIVSGHSLSQRKTTSCGCYHKEKIQENRLDLTGKRFGRLVVIGSRKKTNPKTFLWLCKCYCGNEKYVHHSSLISGKTVSCGCYAKENNRNRIIKDFGEASFNNLYYTYIRHAKKRNLCFELSKDFFKNITKQNCYYCGVEPKQMAKWQGYNGGYTYNGIDRINSSNGYVENNVVPCCGTCNVAKKDYDRKEFLFWVERVYKHSIEDRLKTKGETIND